MMIQAETYLYCTKNIPVDVKSPVFNRTESDSISHVALFIKFGGIVVVCVNEFHKWPDRL